MTRTAGVAASTRLRPLLAGACRRGRVLGVFPSAVYVQIAALAGSRAVDDLVVVETVDGVRLPRSAVVAAASGQARLQAVCRGDEAYVGRGHLDIGPLAFEVVRWWSPRLPRPWVDEAYDDARLTAVSKLLPGLPPELEDRLGALANALAAADSASVPAAVGALLGLGAGLTPEGDDVLAGLLVMLAARPAARPLAAWVGETVDALARTRTTTLSAALLRDAVQGFAVPALVDLVDALHEVDDRHHDDAIPTADASLNDVVVRLLDVGHSSGAALAHGAVAAARLPAAVPA